MLPIRKVVSLAIQCVDSAIPKTCNNGEDVALEEFKKLYCDLSNHRLAIVRLDLSVAYKAVMWVHLIRLKRVMGVNLIAIVFSSKRGAPKWA